MPLLMRQLCAPAVESRFEKCTLRISPPTLGFFAEWSEWLKIAFIEAVERQTRKLPLTDRAALLTAAHEQAELIDAFSPESSAALARPDGRLAFCAILLRKHQPTITPTELAKLLNPDELERLTTRAIQLVGEHAPEPTGEEVESGGPRDYAPLLWIAASQFGWTPQQLADLTFAQVAALIESTSDHSGDGKSGSYRDRKSGKRMRRFANLQEAIAFRDRQRAKSQQRKGKP